MKKPLKIALWLIGLVLLLLAIGAYQVNVELDKARSEDPLVWEEDVRALEEASRGRWPPGEAVVFIGSSSIRFWETLEQDMAPIPVLQHGFGGSKLNDVVHYAERLVVAYQPRAVVVFAGTNDITPEASKEPAALLERYQAFVAVVRSAQPQVPIFFIAITPSILRWEVWDLSRATNALIAQWSATQDGLYVIDTGAALLDSAGQPNESNYVFDGLHLSARGYGIWARLVRPPLLRELGLATQP